MFFFSLSRITLKMITTVNFHLIKACNFKCKFCYATFDDISSKTLSKDDCFTIVKLLSESGLFRKVNFAGGEPTLVPYIDELIKYTKILGFETSIVTNTSRINAEWVKNISPYLDILAMSIDSIEEQSNIASGRNQKGVVIQKEHFKNIAMACHRHNVQLKINTVVSQFNHQETVTEFINELNPFRWKVMQVTRVEGQNDAQFDTVKISSQQFEEYCARNKQNLSEQIKLVVEPEEIIQGSYLMIDPLGRFFDSSNKKHNYSDKILEVGIEKALQQVNIDTSKFEKRQGNYTVLNLNKVII